VIDDQWMMFKWILKLWLKGLISDSDLQEAIKKLGLKE